MNDTMLICAKLWSPMIFTRVGPKKPQGFGQVTTTRLSSTRAWWPSPDWWLRIAESNSVKCM
jgi:hypothetical protein